MKYMLLIYGDEHALSETERKDCYAESTQLAHDLNANGQYVAANPLHPTAMATSVRVRNGKRLVTDGPFAETREQLGGYFLIDAKDLDEAIAVAARIPMARKGTVEVRPVIAIPGLPTD
ncbi:MAG: YciI family protein [Nitrospirae bacterium]|nr:MAG: YciI family protein [Nitrospirota bacterium]